MTTVYAYHELSKQTVAVPQEHVDHPILGKHLTVVRSGKSRGRLSDIVADNDTEHTTEIAVIDGKEDAPATSARRVTNVVTPDKDKED